MSRINIKYRGMEVAGVESEEAKGLPRSSSSHGGSCNLGKKNECSTLSGWRVQEAQLHKGCLTCMAPNNSSYLEEKTRELEFHFLPTLSHINNIP